MPRLAFSACLLPSSRPYSPPPTTRCQHDASTLRVRHVAAPSALVRLPLTFMNTSCQLDGGRLTLHHSLPSASIGCQRSALELVASRVVALVVTWSAGSQQAERGSFAGLERVFSRYHGSPDVVAIAYGKGSPCQRMPPPLWPWVNGGSALCISGRNVVITILF